MNKQVSFILPVASQPRFQKRIQSFREKAIACHIFSFERNYFEGKKDEMNYISLGFVSHGSYLKRIGKMFKSLMILIKHKKLLSESVCLYAFGLDNALLALILKYFVVRTNPKVVCEIGDIRSTMVGNTVLSKALRQIERRILSKVSCIVVTSPAYRDEYIIKVQRISAEKIQVVENKLYPPMPDVKTKESRGNSPLVIGFFGLLRCQRSWNILSRLAKQNKSGIKIYIKGYLMNIDRFQEELAQNANMIYEGEYVSPDDLADMYEKIDICWIGNMSNNDINGSWALPNRLYESLYYQTPIIAHSKSGVAAKIKQYNCGWAVDFDDEEHAVRFIESLTREDILEKTRNCVSVPREDLVAVYDHDKLVEKILEEAGT